MLGWRLKPRVRRAGFLVIHVLPDVHVQSTSAETALCTSTPSAPEWLLSHEIWCSTTAQDAHMECLLCVPEEEYSRPRDAKRLV